MDGEMTLMRHQISPLWVFLLIIPWLWPISIGPYAEALPWLFSLSVAALLLFFWPRKGVVESFALALVVAAVLGVIPGLLQYFGLSHLDFFWPWIRSAPPGYASGNIGQPNQQATFLAMGLIGLCWFMRTLGLRWWMVVSGSFIALGMAATASRIGVVHVVVICFLTVYWGDKERKSALQWCAYVISSYFISALILPDLASEIGVDAPRSLWFRIQNAEVSCGSRLLLWSNVIELIKLKPWLGWGWGDLRYAQYVTLFEGTRWCAALGNAHNLPLHLAVTLGIPLAFLISLVALVLFFKGRPWSEVGCDRQLAWSLLAIIGFHSMVEYPLWYGPFQIAVCLCFYILYGCNEECEKLKLSRKSIVRMGFSLLMLVGGFWGVRDYWRVSQPYLLPQQRAQELRDLPTSQSMQAAIDFSSKTFFFQQQALFARLLVMSPNNENALVVSNIATYLLHFSPEPKVLTKLLDSLLILHEQQKFNFHAERFKSSFPREYEAWEESSPFFIKK
jgi:O-antigen ligase